MTSVSSWQNFGPNIYIIMNTQWHYICSSTCILNTFNITIIYIINGWPYISGTILNGFSHEALLRVTITFIYINRSQFIITINREITFFYTIINTFILILLYRLLTYLLVFDFKTSTGPITIIAVKFTIVCYLTMTVTSLSYLFLSIL